MRNFFIPYVFHKDSLEFFKISAAYLISGKFLGLLSPFILRGVVNSMASQTIATSGGAAIAGFSTMRFWKAGLALMLWGGTRALSTILVQNHMLSITKAI